MTRYVEEREDDMGQESLSTAITTELEKVKQINDAVLKDVLSTWNDAAKQMGDAGTDMATGFIAGLSDIATGCETAKSFLEPSIQITKGLATALEKGGTSGQGAVSGIQAFGGALNTAMGVVGLVAMAVTTLISVFQELTKADAAYQALADGASDFKAECEEATVAQQQSLAVTQAQGPVAQGLVDKIKGLTDAQGNLTGSQSECAEAVAQLNQMYPGLNLQLDTSTGKLNMNAAEMENNVAGMQKMAEAEALQGQYTKLIEQKTEAELNRKVAIDEAREAMIAQGGAIAEQAKQMSDEEIIIKANNNALWEYNSNTNAALDAVRDLGENEKQLGVCTTMLDEETQAQAANAQGKQDAIAAVKQLSDAEAAALIAKQENNQTLSEEDAKALDAWKSTNQSKYDAMVAANELEKQLYDQKLSYTKDAFTNVQEEMNNAEVVSLDQMVANLNANQAAMEAWTTNQKVLAENGLGGLVEVFSDMGPQGFAQAQYLVNQIQSGADISGLVSALGYDMEQVNAAAQDFDYEGAYNSSKEMIDSSAKGVASSDALLNASEQQITDSVSKMRSTILDDGNFYYLGIGIINRLAQGMQLMKGKLYDTADSIVNGLKDRLRINGKVTVSGSGINSRASISWYDKGGYFNSPQLIGIAERRPEFVGAAEDLEAFIAKSVNNAFVRIDPALLHDIGSIGGGTSYAGDTVDFHPQVTINTQKLTDAEMKRATNYVSREFAKIVTGRKVGRLQ